VPPSVTPPATSDVVPSARALSGYLPTGQAARRIGCSTTWVYRLCADDRLDCIETPLGRLVSEASVEAEIARREARHG
jgi:hypothetical protein